MVNVSILEIFVLGSSFPTCKVGPKFWDVVGRGVLVTGWGVFVCVRGITGVVAAGVVVAIGIHAVNTKIPRSAVLI